MAEQLQKKNYSTNSVNPWNELVTLPPQHPYGSSAIRFGLSLNQYRFCCEMLTNGLNKFMAAKNIGLPTWYINTFIRRTMRNERVINFLAYKHKEMEEKVDITIEWKYRKLKHIIDVCFPDTTTAYDRLTIDPKVALQVIAEMNKMAGHYAATKQIIDIPFDKTELLMIRELMSRVGQENQKDY